MNYFTLDDANGGPSSFQKGILDYSYSNVMLESAKPMALEAMSMPWIDASHTNALKVQRYSDEIGICVREEFEKDDNSMDVDPKKYTIKRKANATINVGIKQKLHVEDSPKVKRCVTEGDDISFVDASIEAQSSNRQARAIDGGWMKNYYERNLEQQRQQIQEENERHEDDMNFQKITIMLQERIEKTKSMP